MAKVVIAAIIAPAHRSINVAPNVNATRAVANINATVAKIAIAVMTVTAAMTANASLINKLYF